MERMFFLLYHRFLHRIVMVGLITFLAGVSTLSACKKNSEDNPPSTDSTVVLTPYEIIPPAHFPVLKIPDDNKPSVERIKLGRMLYYDTLLSNDGKACAGCHLQSKGFTTDLLYQGVTVLPHENLAWNTNFMWNASIQGTLEDAMLFEVQTFFATNLEKVNQNSTYRQLVKKYFGVNKITYKELSYSLAQFVRTLISRDTKYDRFIRGEIELSYDELQGRNLFFSERGDCFHCHINPVMTDNQLHNIGLDSLYSKELDKGFFNLSGKVSDLGKFRTPNLRNVALRKHLMHDGRFSSLEEVVEFYNSGVHKVTNVDPIMTKPGKENGLNLSSQEKMQIVAFLQTLTDLTMLADTTLSTPN
ncbi:MAG: hypothetical protein JST88_03625 [Bacteroidetes bacterium]|nr:hypothetical protein [Bacteroidota bacterium]